MCMMAMCIMEARDMRDHFLEITAPSARRQETVSSLHSKPTWLTAAGIAWLCFPESE